MPLKTNLWKTNLIGAIWLNNALKDHRPNSKDRMPTSTELKKELDDEAWNQLFPDASHPRPRDRTIQSVQQKFKHLYSTFLEDIQERVVKPLGDGWPRGGDDLAYMLALQRLWSRQTHSRLGLTGATAELWTREDVDVALELKIAFDWPNGFDEFAGPAHRKPWQLQHPYAAREIPGEIAIIKELALRRVCSQEGVEGFEGNPHNDIYEILMDRPWDANHSRSTHYGDVRFTRPVWATMLWEGLGDTSVVGIANAIRVLWRNHFEMYFSLIGVHSEDESDLQPAKEYILDLLEQKKEVDRITGDLCPPLELMSRSAADGPTPRFLKTSFQRAIDTLPIKHTWSIAFQADQMLKWAFEHLGIPTDLSPEAVLAVDSCSDLHQILFSMPNCEHPDDFQAVADERGVDVMEIGEDGELTNLAFDRAWNRHEQGYGLWCEACESRSFEDSKFSLWL